MVSLFVSPVSLPTFEPPGLYSLAFYRYFRQEERITCIMANGSRVLYSTKLHSLTGQNCGYHIVIYSQHYTRLAPKTYHKSPTPRN